MVQAVSEFDDFARHRLRRLDSLLDQLEALNLAEITPLPRRIATALQNAGVESPAERTVTELIDRVFDLQEPILKLMASRGRRRV